jgi:hypothetical protein
MLPLTEGLIICEALKKMLLLAVLFPLALTLKKGTVPKDRPLQTRINKGETSEFLNLGLWTLNLEVV